MGKICNFIFLVGRGIFLTDYSHGSFGDLIDVTLADEAAYSKVGDVADDFLTEAEEFNS